MLEPMIAWHVPPFWHGVALGETPSDAMQAKREGATVGAAVGNLEGAVGSAVGELEGAAVVPVGAAGVAVGAVVGGVPSWAPSWTSLHDSPRKPLGQWHSCTGEPNTRHDEHVPPFKQLLVRQGLHDDCVSRQVGPV